MADPKLNELTNDAKELNKELGTLNKLLGGFSNAANQFKTSFNTVSSSLKTATSAAKGAVSGIRSPSGRSSTAEAGARMAERIPTSTVWSSSDGPGGTTQSYAAGGNGGMGSPGAAMGSSVSAAMSGGGGGGLGSMFGFSNGGSGSVMGKGLSGLLSAGIGALQKASDVYGSLAGAGLQYSYNRIQGNKNTVLQLSQALGPNAGMMGMNTETMLTGLAQRAPVLGSNSDIVGTILAGQSVGAFMSGNKASKGSGIPGRNGFFESVRQMQLLTPGVSASDMSTALANYIGNTQSQQMGQYIGQGAFTMIGKGGSYKTLAEWAESILKFLSEQRPGKQGTKFGKDELMAQNFPGSNINAWFRMMGVPQAMVDYWWQYALANAGQTSPMTRGLIGGDGKEKSQTAIMQENIQSVRGTDLAYERLRTTTQATRRDYLLGSQMFGLYNAAESSDRRFNVGMQAADLTLGNMARTTNAGAAMALLPTSIMELLLPMMTKLASSPIGTSLSLFQNVKDLFGDPIGDPVGDYGPTGSTSTRHLSPDLAKKVDAMMKANPRLRISSGYRDTVTQDRLHKNGVGRVGPASKSKHTRGWAADIGPVSELGWVQANAGKFGLQTAANVGEPWHVQSAGTMPVGDFPIGDNIFSDMLGGMTSIASGLLGGLGGGGAAMTGILTKFISGGSMSSLIDNAISLFIKLLTAPISGLARAFGTTNLSNEDLANIVNDTSNIKVDVSKYAGFTSSTNSAINGSSIFGDPISMASQAPATIHARMDSPIIFKTEITVGSGAGSSPIDAQRTAATIANHLEAELTRREWRKS